MSILRKSKPNRFTSISNDLLQDDCLSFEARGLLAYLLSKPDDWQCSTHQIEQEGGLGKEKRRRIMLEAEKAGYLTFVQHRDERGRFVSEFLIHESPVIESEKTQSWLTGAGKRNLETDDWLPDTGKADTGFPDTRKAGTLLRTELQNTELQNTELQIGVGQNAFQSEKPFCAAPEFLGKVKSEEGIDEWLDRLQSSDAYKEIAVKMEYAKMLLWCENHHKQPTRRRMLAWLNRIETPITGTRQTASQSPTYRPSSPKQQEQAAPKSCSRCINSPGWHYPKGREAGVRPCDHQGAPPLDLVPGKMPAVAELMRGM